MQKKNKVATNGGTHFELPSAQELGETETTGMNDWAQVRKI